MSQVTNSVSEEEQGLLRLRAGSLEMLLHHSAIRRIKLGSTEIVRSIYAAVRDRDWGTVPFIPVNVEINQEQDSFELKIHGIFGQDSSLGEAEIIISGKPPANLEFSFHFTATRSFLKNRIGICVLLPIEECLGMPYILTQSDGQEIRNRFPEFIAPHQPLLDIRSLEWQIDQELKARLEFEGDVFEMEDQRNWSDASFKIYCTPLSLPFPLEVSRGEVFAQKVVLSIPVLRTIPYHPEAIEIKFTGKSFRLPGIGYCLDGDFTLPDQNMKKAFLELPFSHVRVDIQICSSDAVESLRCAFSVAAEYGCLLELALHTREGVSLPARFTEVLQINKKLLLHIMVFNDENYISTGTAELELLSLLREDLGNVSLGGGSNANFAELNRNRVSPETIDFIAVATNPQVHASDEMSMVENLEGLGYIMKSLKHLYPGKPIIVSPLSLKPRFNAVATSGINDELKGFSSTDPKIRKVFGAIWILSAVKRLATNGAESFTLAGLNLADAIKLPREEKTTDTSFQTPLFSLLHFFFRPLQEWQVLESFSTLPEEIEAFVVQNKMLRIMMVFNFSDHPRQIKLPAFAGTPEITVISDNSTMKISQASCENLFLEPMGVYVVRYS